MRPFYALILATLLTGCGSAEEPFNEQVDTCAAHTDCGEFELCSDAGGWEASGPLECRPFSDFTWSFHAEVMTCEEEPEESGNPLFEPCEGGDLVLIQQEPEGEWSGGSGKMPDETSVYRFAFEDYDYYSDNDVLFDQYVPAGVLFSAWKASPSGRVELEGHDGGPSLLVELSKF